MLRSTSSLRELAAEHLMVDPSRSSPSTLLPPPTRIPTRPFSAVDFTPLSATRNVPFHLLSRSRTLASQTRLFSSSRRRSHRQSPTNDAKPKLTHVSESGSAHMVSISDKTPTKRTAKAVCSVKFTDGTAIELIRKDQMKKGDVIGVARVAGIMAAKRTADLIPLCHPIAITKVTVDLSTSSGSDGAKLETPRVDIEATVSCEGKTGVEMEALMAASTAALTVYDMCKAVDKGMIIEGLRVVLKEGGKSGTWVEGDRQDDGHIAE
jgi:cyclic pyranopterin phosphate synthase